MFLFLGNVQVFSRTNLYGSFSVQEASLNLEDWFFGLAARLGYLGVFLLSLIGAASIIIPIPYTIVIFWLGAYGEMDITLLALTAGLGSALGEILGYIIGYASHGLVSESRKKRLEAMLLLLTRYGYMAPLLIFFFALTPLPDDLIFIPLGLLHYPLWKALIPSLLGKVVMSYLLAQGGQVYNQLILTLLGGEAGLVSVISAVITTVLLIVVVFVIWRVDWEDILLRYEGRKRD